MTDLRTAAQQALGAMEAALSDDQPYIERCKQTITALRAALAEPEQEPVAWMHTNATGYVYFRKNPQDKVFNPQPLYATPFQRKLTDEVIADLWHQNGGFHHHFARAIERWLKGEK